MRVDSQKLINQISEWGQAFSAMDEDFEDEVEKEEILWQALKSEVYRLVDNQIPECSICGENSYTCGHW